MSKMQSYMMLSSESSEQSDESRRYQLLQQENAKLREKIAKTQTKYHKLKQDYDEILLQKELLEEQNKLLESTKQPPQKEKNTEQSIPSSQVSKILSDFDTLLEMQGREITQLMNDRDKLSSICFLSLSLISQQEIFLKKFQNGTQKLIQFMSSGDSSYDSVIQDFSALGYDIQSIVNSVQRKIDVQQLVESLNRYDSPPIDPNEVIRIINELPNINLTGDSLQIVTQFIMQQISSQKRLISEIDEQRARFKELKEKLNQAIQACKPPGAAKFGLKDLTRRYLELQEKCTKSENLEQLSRQIVEVFEAFGSRFPDNSDTQRCLMRIRFWLDNPESEVDVIQEIDFLLGLCIPSKVIDKNADNSSALSETTSSVTSLIERIGITKKTIQTSDFNINTNEQKNIPTTLQTATFESDLLSQIRLLRREVSEMKERFVNDDEERKRFIFKHFKKSIPQSTKWPQVCEYLLSSR